MRFDLSERRVIVTGGTGALGSAVVQAALDAGARCVVPVYHASELERAAWRDSDRVRAIENIDLSKEDSVEGFYKEACGGEGLWASVHIVGGFAMGPLLETSAETFRQQMDLNATTAFLCTREAARRMAGAGGGRIVNVAARPALFPELGKGMVPYATSKAAVAALTQASAAELAGTGVMVNAVIPDVMDTPANRKAMPDADFDGWAKVEQVASTVLFLIASENGATRGGLVPVYGRG